MADNARPIIINQVPLPPLSPTPVMVTNPTTSVGISPQPVSTTVNNTVSITDVTQAGPGQIPKNGDASETTQQQVLGALSDLKQALQDLAEVLVANIPQVAVQGTVPISGSVTVSNPSPAPLPLPNPLPVIDSSDIASVLSVAQAINELILLARAQTLALAEIVTTDYDQLIALGASRPLPGRQLLS